VTDEQIFEGVMQTILRETRATFWKRLTHWFEWVYSDAYQGVANDPNILSDQRSAKLLDDRFYFAEKALQSAAKEAGLITSGQKITVNNWNYTLVRAGGVCMVQSYTPSPSELARAARFRETHAAVNRFLSSPQLALGDVEPAIFELAKINGIITHGPVGKGFGEEDQRLAFLNFAIPDESYSVWGINIPVAEIIARFEHSEIGVEAQQRDIALPRIKRPGIKKQENGSGKE
jgi:hypothetical protein